MTKPGNPLNEKADEGVPALERLRRKLSRGEPVFGAAATLLDPTASEILGYAGFDFVWIDMEHTALSPEHVLSHLMGAASARTAGFVRVPWNDPVLVKPILDMGPDGIIFPCIRTAEDARRAVSACEYPPKGIRGCGPRRAVRYGIDDLDGYMREGSKRFWKIMQIEHVDCVKNLDEIASIPGIDCWLVGPWDLSCSVGCLGKQDVPEVQELIDEACSKATRHGMLLAAWTGDEPASIRKWQERGVKIFTTGVDSSYLMSAARKSLQTARETAGAKAIG